MKKFLLSSICTLLIFLSSSAQQFYEQSNDSVFEITRKLVVVNTPDKLDQGEMSQLIHRKKMSRDSVVIVRYTSFPEMFYLYDRIIYTNYYESQNDSGVTKLRLANTVESVEKEKTDTTIFFSVMSVIICSLLFYFYNRKPTEQNEETDLAGELMKRGATIIFLLIFIWLACIIITNPDFLSTSSRKVLNAQVYNRLIISTIILHYLGPIIIGIRIYKKHRFIENHDIMHTPSFEENYG